MPDHDHSVVTAGYGTDGNNDFATGVWRSNRNRILYYFPAIGGGTMTVDMSKLRGANANTSWFDPTTGSETTIGQFASSGSRVFTGPGNNAGGDTDWIFSAAGGF